MQENPDRSMSIHVIPSIVSYADPLAFTPSNIVAGFQKIGIYPFDKNKYLQSFATYQPFSSEMIQLKDAATMQNNSSSIIQTDTASQLVQQDIPTALHEKKQSLDDDDPSCLDVSTESTQPLGHLEYRPSTSHSWFKVKSLICTDTGIKNLLLQKKNLQSAVFLLPLVNESYNSI